MRATTHHYDRKQRAWRIWTRWEKAYLRARYPETGGSAHLVQNWYRCGDDPTEARMALRHLRYTQERWERLHARYKRLYDRALAREQQIIRGR